MRQQQVATRNGERSDDEKWPQGYEEENGDEKW